MVLDSVWKNETIRMKIGYQDAETSVQGIIIRHAAPCCLGYINDKKIACAIIEVLNKTFLFLA